MNEFDLIKQYFDWGEGVGDDCALIDIDAYQQLVSSVDTLIEGVHFPANTSPQDIAYKALAVNLSDLAAMGATPKCFTLALTLPNVDKQWLEGFSSSLRKIAKKYNIRLVGGDTTKGLLSITINVMGEVETGRALLRSTAQVGDVIFVSNTLGDAALAWQQIQKQHSFQSPLEGKTPSATLLEHFNHPQPQIKLGQSLLGVANSCIDISDGLEQDLSHILTHSKVGAIINVNTLPISDEVAQYIANTGDWCVALAGGDDYELCFTVAKSHQNEVQRIATELNLKLTAIGVITEKLGLIVQGLKQECQSYQHF